MPNDPTGQLGFFDKPVDLIQQILRFY